MNWLTRTKGSFCWCDIFYLMGNSKIPLGTGYFGRFFCRCNSANRRTGASFQHFEAKILELKCINSLNNSIADGAIVVTSKFIERFCSRSISVPNIIVELKNISIQNPSSEKMIEYYFNRLLKKVG